jgi:hypothetical protein
MSKTKMFLLVGLMFILLFIFFCYERNQTTRFDNIELDINWWAIEKGEKVRREMMKRLKQDIDNRSYWEGSKPDISEEVMQKDEELWKE